MVRTTFYQKPKRIERLSRNEELELMFDLINSFRVVKTPIETANFLQDLLTAKEIKNLAKRLRIAKLLLNNITYEEIVRTLHVSYATVAKVSTWFSQGGEGFRKVIARLPAKYALPKNLPPVPLEFQFPKAVLSLIQYSVATGQNKRLDKFFEGVKEKEITDKRFRELTGQYYKGKRKTS